MQLNHSSINTSGPDSLNQLTSPESGHRLLADPLHLPEHLGRPIPDSPHAVSVAMPTWRDVVDYENGVPRVSNALQAGYPRFVIKGFTAELFEKLSAIHCAAKESLVAFPSKGSARRCLEFVQQEFPGSGRIEDTQFAPITACVVPVEAYRRARSYWQHTGEIISTRWAEACIKGLTPVEGPSVIKHTIRERLAGLASASSNDVALFPSGMAAITSIQRAVQISSPGIRTAQIGFPYVDTLKVQEKFGSGYIFLAANGSQDALDEDLKKLDSAAAAGQVAALYCEFPANPLLTVPPLERLWEISLRHQVPLIIDETLGSLSNVRLLPYATAIVTSLTKYVSGEGDVCAGSVIWNAHHPAYETLHHHWAACVEDQLFEGDAVALERNSRDFPQRMSSINKGAAQLVAYLADHPAIEAVYYPNLDPNQKAIFDRFRLEGGGYGGLFSFRVKGGLEAAALVYDTLAISKGPSLGTNFTIACPYTQLAHFLELDKVAELGVSADLVRVSVGLEHPDDLIERFSRALAVLNGY